MLLLLLRAFRAIFAHGARHAVGLRRRAAPVDFHFYVIHGYISIGDAR